MIYLDSAASYPPLPEAQEALIKSMEESFGNSMAAHTLAGLAAEEIEQVRQLLADLIGAFKSEIVFTSGATESNNLAIKGLLLDPTFPNDKRHLVVSAVEHKCIHAICDYMKRQGFSVDLVPPNSMGVITVEKISNALREDTALVSVMHANNETGVINDIEAIGRLCFQRDILFHVDAAQTLGKLPIDVDDLSVDLMSFSAHKIGGPKGVGAVYIRDLRKLNLTPVIHGAGQEEGVRGGTVPSPLIKSFGAAIEHFPKHFVQLKEAALKSSLLVQLADAGIDYQVNGQLSNSLPHVVSISLPKTDVSLLLRNTDAQFCLAQGSACSAADIEASHVLTALGLSRDLAERTLRISFSQANGRADIEKLVREIEKVSI